MYVKGCLTRYPFLKVGWGLSTLLLAADTERLLYEHLSGCLAKSYFVVEADGEESKVLHLECACVSFAKEFRSLYLFNNGKEAVSGENENLKWKGREGKDTDGLDLNECFIVVVGIVRENDFCFIRTKRKENGNVSSLI